MNMKKLLLTILLIGFASFTSAQQSQVEFSLDINNAVDSGESYTNYSAGETPVQARFVIGFEIDILSVDLVPVSLDPIVAFCSEIQEPIGINTYTFDASPLSNLAQGTASLSGTASSGMPSGGIGDLRAARLQYFFDQNYTSTDLTGWTQLELHAFQLGLWELTHDSDLNLTNISGDNYLGTQSSAFRNDAMNLAQTWLDDISSFNPSTTYTSTQFKFWALTDDGAQDVILATLIGSDAEEELTPIIVVPENNSLALFFISLVPLVALVSRKR
jgi:hypothetical protein